jgi:hypothetical protein
MAMHPKTDKNLRPDRPAVQDVALAFLSYGLRVGVTLCDGIEAGALARVLPPHSEPLHDGALDRHFRLERLDAVVSPIGQAGYHWLDEGEFRRFASTPELAIEYGESVIEHVVAEFAPRFIFIHAGVVTWHDRAIILPGTSRAGKSTLVRAFVNAGATYFTDEYAVLDAEGRVYPYLRQLSQREGPFGPAGRIDLARHAPDPDAHRNGAAVGLVVLTRYEDGGIWQAESLSAAEAMMAMSQHVIAIRRRPADAFAVMRLVAESAPVLEGARGDAEAAARHILASLDAAERLAPDARGDFIAQRLGTIAG